MEEVDIEKVSVSRKTCLGEKNCKYFIDYLYIDHKIKPLNMTLPTTSAYVKIYESKILWTYFSIENDDLSKNGDKVKDFCNRKIPKLDSNGSCLAVISLDSSLKKDDNYYPQVFLKECTCSEKKVVRHIDDNLSDFSYSSNESDEE